jgi:putative ABC transport system permease protein
VAVLAVLTVLYALLDEQRRELGVLRALGASRTQTGGFVLAQSAVIGVSGTLLGVVAGFAIGVVLVKVVNLQSFGWTMRLMAPWPSLAGTPTAVAVACVLAGLPPALMAARSHPREALHEDG